MPSIHRHNCAKAGRKKSVTAIATKKAAIGRVKNMLIDPSDKIRLWRNASSVMSHRSSATHLVDRHHWNRRQIVFINQTRDQAGILICATSLPGHNNKFYRLCWLPALTLLEVSKRTKLTPNSNETKNLLVSMAHLLWDQRVSN